MRYPVLALSALFPLTACGESADDLAFARCKDEISMAFGPTAIVAVAADAGGELRDDLVYGWHMDVEVTSDDRAERAGYRCLFLVEGRQAPLFLAVVER